MSVWQRLCWLVMATTLAVVLTSILLVLPLRWLNPVTTAFILQDKRSQGFNPANHWADHKDVSPTVFFAILSAEDQKYFTHWGLDFSSIKQALAEDRSKLRGASTISQQLAKNLYLWSGRSYFRKGVEAWMTLWLELLLSKQRILELYVNVVEFGPGIYGVNKASQQFFSKPPALINTVEASLLAAVLPNPKQYSVIKPSSYTLERSDAIRRWMPDMALLYNEHLQKRSSD